MVGASLSICLRLSWPLLGPVSGQWSGLQKILPTRSVRILQGSKWEAGEAEMRPLCHPCCGVAFTGSRSP